jgi:peptidoglycan lytic transglycosylase D
MRLRLLVSALVLASCAPQRPAGAPAPVPQPAPPPITLAPPAAELPRPVADSAKSVVPVSPADSLALAKQARDSALDAAMLERLATAKPPEEVETLPANAAEAEAATLRSMFDIDVANFADHGRVKYYLNFFTGLAHERMAVWLQRMPLYEPTIRTQLVARGLPGDLAYLPLIESGYSSTAVSRSRAVGMWQFMRATGKLYGLKVDNWVDERRDVVKATEAAIRYLADLTTKFGSPYLAAAAYNGGPGRIQRGLKRIDLVEEDEPDDSTAEDSSDAPQAGDAAFFLLADTRYIKRETKDYVPKLIAAAMIAKQPQRYGFKVPEAVRRESDSVVVTDATGLDVVARLAGVSLADLWAANPAYVRAVTPPKRRAVLRLPAGMGGSTQDALDALPASERLTGFAHHTKRGETLVRIAKRYGVTLAALRASNPEYLERAPSTGAVVRVPGQARLLGWLGENRRVDGPAASGSTHRVRSGETLSGIGARYRVSVAKLRAWNHLGPKAVLRVGQLLRVSGASSGARAPRTAAASAARVHIVKAGETLTSLARRYKVTLQALRTANAIPAGRPLLAGQRLTIPS